MADELSTLRAALEEGPTPGPWIVEENDGGYITGRIVRADAHTYCGNKIEREDSVTGESSMTVRDADFIAACRNGVPALFTAHDALRAENAELQDKVIALGVMRTQELYRADALEAELTALRRSARKGAETGYGGTKNG